MIVGILQSLLQYVSGVEYSIFPTSHSHYTNEIEFNLHHNAAINRLNSMLFIAVDSPPQHNGHIGLIMLTKEQQLQSTAKKKKKKVIIHTV